MMGVAGLVAALTLIPLAYLLLRAVDGGADALEAAGGPVADADLTSVNLARPVRDGEQIRVLLHEVNQGKGAALRRGFGHALDRGEVQFFQQLPVQIDPQRKKSATAATLSDEIAPEPLSAIALKITSVPGARPDTSWNTRYGAWSSVPIGV